MKKVYLAISYLLIANILFAQTPQGFNYQAVVRNSSGTPIANQNVSLKITLQSGSGSAYFSESKSITTNAQGVINHIVGSGTLISGEFSTIPWSSGDVYLLVELDPAGGTAYVQMGDPARLQSVPYALYAASGNQGTPGVDGNGISGVVDNGDGSLTFNFTDGSSYKTPILKGEKGEKGDAGTGLNNRGNWQYGLTYNPGDYVFASNSGQTGNSMWIVQAATAFTSNIEPRLDLTNWVEFQAPKGDTGDKGENGISILWLGSFSGIPTSYSLNNAYYNSTEKKSFVYTSTGWQQMTQDGIPISGTTGQTLYYNGTAWTPTSTLYNNNTNVGIGTTSPTQKLDVNGGIRLRSSIYDASNSAGSANQLLVNNGSGAVWQSTYASGITSGTGTAGQVALWSGTNSIQGISNLSWGTTSLQIASPTNAGTDDPILEVKNKDGKVVLGVYQGGVRIYVDDSQITKGVRGGFAVGGLTNQSKEQQEYFRITPDSARIYVKEVPTTKGARGGFAIGGLTNQSKTIVNRNLMFVAPDSARFWVNETVAKGVRGGFAIGGLTNQGKGAATNFMQLTPENYFIGHQSGSRVTTGLYNNFLGYQTGLSNTTGSSNSFIGYKAGYSNTSGASNVFVGNQSGYTNSTGEYNTFLGYNAGFTNNSSYNTFLGYQAGKDNTSGQYNSFMGYNAGLANTTGSKNLFLGFQSGSSNTSGTSNVYLGTNAGFKNNGIANVVIGDSTASQMTSGNYNIVIGRKAGLSLSSGSWNVLIGESAGYSSAFANYNVMIGQSAGYNTTTSFNTYVGINAGYKINSGNNNVFLGTNAGAMLESGSANTIIGIDAGRSGSWDPGIYHGFSASNNTLIGTGAGYNFDSGDKNTIMGCLSGSTLTTGSGNVFIGYKAGSGIDGVSDQLYIANEYGTPLIYGNFSTKLIGFGTTSPSSNLHIEATSLNQNGHFLVNRSNTGGLGGTIVIRNRTSVYPGNAAALSFVLDGSTAFETDGSNASNAEIRSTMVDFTGATNLQISNWNGTSQNVGIVLYSSGDVTLGNSLNVTNTVNTPNLNVTSYAYIGGDVVTSGTIESSYLWVNENATIQGTLTGNVTGNLTGNVTGDVTGNVNGIKSGKIYLSGSGTILTNNGGLFVLSISGKALTFTNNSTSYVHVWWQGEQGTTAVGGSQVVNNVVGSTLSLPSFSNNGDGIEIHFGLENGTSYCSVWLQYSNSKVFGHYMSY